MKIILYIFIVLFGFFYHISSSEFWPVTISKTWFHLANFEYSMLQKTLFSLFLSFFHLLNFDDVTHILLVKLLFSIIGLLSLMVFTKLSLEITQTENKTYNFKKLSITTHSLLILLILLISPVILNNFFRIRTDQVSLLFLSLSLLYNHRKHYYKSLVYLLLIPLTGIKGFVFFIPAFFILYPSHKPYFSQLRPLHKYYLITSIIGVLAAAINFNVGAISYLYLTFQDLVFPNAYLKKFLLTEMVPITASFLSCVIIFYRKETQYKKYAIASVAAFLLILAMPQSYPFYIASLAPVVYLPLIILCLKKIWLNTGKIVLLFTLQLTICSYLYYYLYTQQALYPTNKHQIEYIKAVSHIIEKNNLSYLDGMGILPTQKFIACFVSPDDEAANDNCYRNVMHATADVVIATSRLSYFGAPLYAEIEKNYIQTLPGFWVKKTHSSLTSEDQIDLMKLAPPIFIFGFD